MKAHNLGPGRSLSLLIKFVLGIIGLPLGIIAFLLFDEWLGGWWGFGLGILLGLFVWGAMMQWGESIAEGRLDRESEKLFPELTGERSAAYWLVSLDTAFGQKAFQDKLRPTVICDGGDCLFMRSGEDFGDGPDGLRNQRAVDFPSLTMQWNIAKADILALQLILLSDETITQAGRDPRSASDRVVEAGIGELMGHRRRLKITPFAAMIELVSQREGQIERVVFAIPADAKFDRFRPIDWGEGSMEELLSSQAFTGLVADEMAASSDELEDAAEFVGDYGGATIGTLSVLSELVGDSEETRKGIGNEGRKVALLLAEGLREIAGLSKVQVHRA